MNYGQLKAAIADYLHRSDAAQQIELSVALARTRIGRDLRCSANLNSLEFTYPFDGSFLPADFSEAKEMWYPSGTLQHCLQPMTLTQLSNLSTTGGAPAAFAIVAPAIWIRPQVTGNYQLVYYAIPSELVQDTDTNAVLTLYPQLYLYGALMESFFWAQDGDLTAYAKQQYQEEIQLINAMTRSQPLGSAPAMRRF